ncbi:MAG: c-type cytochrome [Betaproteobacteria bacterium]|nr:c-type cytochrome [Betaproteobacteria bacterium]MSQ89256.1 c-type cytochrome [Betaproteobacteria bacterium]
MPPMTRMSRRSLALIMTLLAACGESPAPGDNPASDPRDAAKVALGAKHYAQHCAACHGAKLEGQRDWRARMPNGRMPAPPHDESGHTWHHPDGVLFGITKNGLIPPYAPSSYESDMPAFAGKLSDHEIRAVLAYIKSHWISAHIIDARTEMTRSMEKR